MITLITGVVGSGKTIFCIEEIVKLKNGTSTFKGHDFIYSNIANFKTDYFDDTPYKYYDLNFSKIYVLLKELYHIYLEYEDKEEDTDTALIEYAKKNNFYNCFIIFDECHHFFDNQDKVKIWYITYHRHIAHNIFLITQNKMLINTKYRQSPELFVKALPMTKKLGSDFKYNTYGEFLMKDKIETINIQNRPELFEMYTSGNFTKQKSYAKKPLIIFISSLALVVGMVVFLFIFMSNSFDTPPPKPEPIKTTPPIQNNQVQNNQVQNNQVQNKNNLIPIDAVGEIKVIKVFYLNTLGYQVQNEWYSDAHFKKFLTFTKSEILSANDLYKDDTRNVKIFYLRTKQDLLNQFFVPLPPPPKVETKEDKNNLPSFSPFGNFQLN